VNRRTHLCWRHVVAVAALACIAVPGAIAQSTGPTRIKIAAGTVSAEDTRVGLLGEWEPDAPLGPGLPPGSNRTIYLADGLYINPLGNVALVAFWSTTANVLTSTPFDIRQRATGAAAPELKDTFGTIAWDKPVTSLITWLTPDRFQEKGLRNATRRAKPMHDVTAVHRATVMDLLRDSWLKPGGATVVFEPDGTFREQAQTAVRGTYDFDAAAGVLRRTSGEVNSPSRAAAIAQIGSRTSSLRWTSRDIVTVDGEQWTRQSKPPEPSSRGRGFLGVGVERPETIVSLVQAGSPAERAGLRVGDFIELVNGRNIQNADDLVRTMQGFAPGTEVVLRVIRNGTRIELRVTVGRLPE
jgi:hypothetical protein